ncbi:MAG: flagellar hook-associated protein FlgK [Lachnospiraceae bacterium]|nr:flagellar hook-associated protein FlgK [Lachnospiraceae bacterium]
MSSTFFGLSIAKSGLYASQAALNTTAHNISNTETTGYSRQVVNQSASKAISVNRTYGMAGTGVDVTGVERMRNAYYDSKYLKNNTVYGEYSSKSYYMTEIENYFNEIESEGFTTTFDRMYDSLQELQKDPSSETIRTQVMNYAQSLCDYFTNLSDNMQKVQTECNFEIKTQVERINSLAQQIASVTKQINVLEVGGGTANDLRDKRDLLVDELSTYASVSTSENVVGDGVGITSFVVKINNQTLVDTYEYNALEVVPRKELVNQNDVAGLYDVQWSNGQKFDTNSATLGGTLHALFQVRDGNSNEAFKGTSEAVNAGDTVITVSETNINAVEKLNIPSEGIITVNNREYKYTGFQVREDEDTGTYVYDFSLEEEITTGSDEVSIIIGENIDYKGIPYYMSQLNQFVRTYAKAFNDIHTTGEDLDGNTGLDFFNGQDAVTGKNYVFKRSEDMEDEDVLFSSKTGDYAVEDEDANYGSYYFLTVSNFQVTKDVYSNPRRFAAASTITDGIENSDSVQGLIDLKNDVTMFRQGKPSSFLQTMIAEIGIDSSKASVLSKNQENILNTVKNQRLSVSGVDTEEEAMNLVQHQNAYNLSAKSVSVLNEIYDKLINYMGV